MSDYEIIALSLTNEFFEIDSENYFFGKLKSDHIIDFTDLIDFCKQREIAKKLRML